jgi:molybdopterin converting factor small subunit
MEEKIEIKLFANLRSFSPPGGFQAVDQKQSILSILEDLNIPKEKVSIILLNGKHAGLEDTVSPGDRLALFPPLGGG